MAGPDEPALGTVVVLHGGFAAATAVGGRASLVEVFGDHFTLIDPSDRDWVIVLGALPGLLA